MAASTDEHRHGIRSDHFYANSNTVWQSIRAFPARHHGTRDIWSAILKAGKRIHQQESERCALDVHQENLNKNKTADWFQISQTTSEWYFMYKDSFLTLGWRQNSKLRCRHYLWNPRWGNSTNQSKNPEQEQWILHTPEASLRLHLPSARGRTQLQGLMPP